MRQHRVNITGALWQLIEGSDKGDVAAFTIVPRTWEFRSDALEAVDPRALLEALRTAIYGGNVPGMCGWIFAYLHGEWDPIGEVYRIHVHGFAAGDMIGLIDDLRYYPNYGTQRFLPNGQLNPVYRRVQISRQPLTNLPLPLTYCLQSYWPARALVICDDGRRIRARRKQRIPEPHHTQVMEWLHQWSIDELTLMIGLRVTKAGLKQTKPVS